MTPHRRLVQAVGAPLPPRCSRGVPYQPLPAGPVDATSCHEPCHACRSGTVDLRCHREGIEGALPKSFEPSGPFWARMAVDAACVHQVRGQTITNPSLPKSA
jgi:hypothetical protein